MYRYTVTPTVKNISAEQIFSDHHQPLSKNMRYSQNKKQQITKNINSEQIKQINAALTRKTYLQCKAFKSVNKRGRLSLCFKNQDNYAINDQQLQHQDNFFPKRVSVIKNNNAAKYFTPSKNNASSRVNTVNTIQNLYICEDINQLKHQQLSDMIIKNVGPILSLKKMQKCRMYTLPQNPTQLRRPKTTNNIGGSNQKKLIRYQKLSPWDDSGLKGQIGLNYFDFIKNKP